MKNLILIIVSLFLFNAPSALAMPMGPGFFNQPSASKPAINNNKSLVAVSRVIPVPGGLNASAVNSSQVNLSCGSVSYGTSTIKYRFYSSKNLNGSYSLISNAGNSVNAINLQGNTRYYFKVQACAGNTCSNLTDAISVLTNQDPTLAIPSWSVSPASSSQINLTWNQYSVSGVKYYAYISSSLNGSYGLVANANGISSSSANAINLQPNTRYYFKTKACLPSSCSALSDPISALTMPGKVSGLRAVVASSKNQVTLSWTSSPDINYTIYRSTASNGACISLGETFAGAANYIDNGALVNNIYYYKIKTRNASGFSSLDSNAVSVSTY